jgi:cellulose biosynthesis protein BcsQ
MSKKTIIIMVTNGRGGVGKTNLTYSLATMLGKAGFKTVALDCDTSETLTRKLDKRRSWVAHGEPDITDPPFDLNSCVFSQEIRSLRNKTRKLVADRSASYDVAVLDISGEFSAVQCNLAPIVDSIVMPTKPEETMLGSTLESYMLINSKLDDEEDLDEADYPLISLAKVMWNPTRLITKACEKILAEEKESYPFRTLESRAGFYSSPYDLADYYGVSIVEADGVGNKKERKAAEKAAFEMRKMCREILMDLGLVDKKMKKLI